MYRKISILIYTVLFLVANIATASQIRILSQTGNSILIEYKPNFKKFQEYHGSDGSVFYKPLIEGTVTEETSAGSPSKIVYKTHLIVPGKDKYNLINSDVIGSLIFDKKILPTPEYDYDNSELSYFADIAAYSQAMEFNPIEINYIGISRGNHIAELKFTVAWNNYNQIHIPEKLIAEIHFDTDIDKSQINQKVDLLDFAINSKQASIWKKAESDIKLQNDETYDNISSGNWLRLEIKSEGIYRISGAKLSELGISNSAELAKTVKIFGHGGKPLSLKVSDGIDNQMNEQRIIVNTKSNGEIEEVLFYAAAANGFHYENNRINHYLNPYSVNNYYLLTYGGRDGLRAEEMTPPAGSPNQKVSKYTERLFFEEELQNPYPHGGGIQWFGQSYFEAPFINRLHNLDRNGEVLYRIALAHKSDDTNGNGIFTIFENNREIDKVYLSATSGEYTHARRVFKNINIPASDIASDNRSKLELKYQNNVIGGYTSYLDYFEIHYPRDMLAIDNEINMITDKEYEGITEFTANGFSGKIYGFDITEKHNPRLLKNSSNTGGMFVFKDDLGGQVKNYFISSKIKTPVISTIEMANLRTNIKGTDVIIITHDDLLESAEEFKKYREENSNLSVSIFTTDAIYNEFSSSLPDLTAIRDFIAFAYHNWDNKPSYVVLWGDGHYDYKNINTSAKNYVPVYQYNTAKESFDEINHDYASEDYYARIDGDDEAHDIALGRLTINSNEEGKWMVEKIRHYEHNSSQDSWRTNAILVADDGPTTKGYDGSDHNDQSEELADYYLDQAFIREKIYLVEYDRQYLGGEIRKPGVTKDILTQINTKSGLFLNFIGHGNPSVWTHERVLERDIHLKLMTNLDKLVFLTAATCDYGRFDNPDIQSGSELFVSNRTGGAIGVFSATRVVFSSSNADINNLLYSKLFSRKSDGSYLTLGEAMFRVKQQRTRPNDEKFFLLGDPTLRLHIPRYNVSIDSINGIATDEITEPYNFEALSNIRISGTIVDELNHNLLEDFNGTVILNIFEGDRYFSLIEPEGTQRFLFTKNGGALNKGAFPVNSGTFEANFIIPKDISFSDSLGRLYGYAFSNDNRYAKGSYRNFIVNGISEGEYNDENGPEIAVYLDDRQFQEGDYVREEPLLIIDLFDETGINTTGLGIGRKIEAWIDDNPVSIDLTDKFTTSLKDSRQGTAQAYLSDLSPGIHTVKVRAWDVFNNVSVAETFFRIANRDEGYFISEHYNYPNPFKTGTTIKIKYNITPPADMKLIIYSSIGQVVREQDLYISGAFSTDIEWNGLDGRGNRLPSGMYIYRIILTDNNGNEVTATGNMILLGN